MKKLTKAEEEVMMVLWSLNKAFVKEIIAELPEPKPHYNTIATIMKILVDKEFVGYEDLGKTYRYYPLVAKEAYSKKSVSNLVKGYFNGSMANMVSFFVKEKDLSVEDLEAIIQTMKKQSDKQ